MKIRSLISLFVSLSALALGLAITGVASAHEGHNKEAIAYTGNGQLVPVDAKTDAAWLAKARTDYPMTTCAVSGDKLEGGDMGKPQEFTYKETGKPDLFVRFCCKDCVKDFNKEPAKYIAMIQEAAAKKTGK
jgi:hypothetical protein